MRRRRHSRKSSAFWRGTLVYLAVLAVLCIGVWVITWNAMIKFEENAPPSVKDTIPPLTTDADNEENIVPETTVPPETTASPEITAVPKTTAVSETTAADTTPPVPVYPAASEEIAAEATAFCDSFIRDYVKFVADGYTDTKENHDKVMSYFAKGTESYNVMNSAIEAVKWNSTFVSHKYDKLEFGEVLFDGELYRTEIIFDVTLYRYSVVNNYKGSFAVAIEDTENGFLIKECNF